MNNITPGQLPQQPSPNTQQETAPASPHPGTFWALLRGEAILFAVAIMTGLFILLTALVLNSNLQPTSWDTSVTQELQELPLVPVGNVLIAVSEPGFAPWNWVIVGLIVAFMLLMRWFPEAIFTALAGVGGLSAEVIKNFIDRPRPPSNLAVHVLNSYSFPSGHVTGYVALYGFVFYLAFTLLPRRSLFKWLILVVTAGLIVLVGPSRVYMGQHWASDALAGYALGFTCLLIVVELYRWWLKRHPKAPVGSPPNAPAQART